MGKPETSSDKSDDNPKSRRSANGKSRSSLGNRIVDALGDRTQAWLARQAGIDPSTLNDIIAGTMPRAERAVALADALDVPLRWLITGEVDHHRGYDDDAWIRMPCYGLADLGSGAKRSAVDFVSIHRDWLNREALGAPALWVTKMPASHLDQVPAEGDMIVCCDVGSPHGEGVYLYRYNSIPLVRRFVAYPATAPGVMDVTTYDFDGMNVIGRVLGSIKLQGV